MAILLILYVCEKNDSLNVETVSSEKVSILVNKRSQVMRRL